MRSTNMKEVMDAKLPVGIRNYKEETRTFFLLFWFVLFFFGILVFCFKAPMRMVADIKNVMRDFLDKWEEDIFK